MCLIKKKSTLPLEVIGQYLLYGDQRAAQKDRLTCQYMRHCGGLYIKCKVTRNPCDVVGKSVKPDDDDNGDNCVDFIELRVRK